MLAQLKEGQTNKTFNIWWAFNEIYEFYIYSLGVAMTFCAFLLKIFNCQLTPCIIIVVMMPRIDVANNLCWYFRTCYPVLLSVWWLINDPFLTGYVALTSHSLWIYRCVSIVFGLSSRGIEPVVLFHVDFIVSFKNLLEILLRITIKVVSFYLVLPGKVTNFT